MSPSRPASGESLTLTVIAMVGGSIGRAFNGSVTDWSHRVSATLAVVRPAMEMISPAEASSTGTRLIPRKASSLLNRPDSIT